MARLIFHEDRIADMDAFLALCPFGALERDAGGRVCATAACKMCMICVKKGPQGAAELAEDAPQAEVDKDAWRGVMVYVDHVGGRIHPVTLELLGKARELAATLGQPVYALMLGEDIQGAAQALLHYGVDEVLLMQDAALRDFRIDAYTQAFEQAIQARRPGTILVGATTVGRQLAPRVAARMRTGLTADCTVLQMKENSDLVQIRPAFGGNIMAQIITPKHRPQMATVRYKVMNAPARSDAAGGRITQLTPQGLCSRLTVRGIVKKPREETIEAAQALVVAGRGVKKEADLRLLERLADALGGQMACTRPLVENGWMEAKRQIGLSGRTVRPRVIVVCGVSGAIQFVAGMDNADTIIAINPDEKAPIFKAAHYGLVGDMYEILPGLIDRLEQRRQRA